MLLDELRKMSSQIEAVARRYGAREIFVFGSVARGEEKADSDIDLLVEFRPDHAPSLAGLFELQEKLSELADGRIVHLATPSILENPFRERSIKRDLKALHAD